MLLKLLSLVLILILDKNYITKDLTGIEYFKNLKKLSVLNCLEDSLDLTHNRELEEFSFSAFSGGKKPKWKTVQVQSAWRTLWKKEKEEKVTIILLRENGVQLDKIEEHSIGEGNWNYNISIPKHLGAGEKVYAKVIMGDKEETQRILIK